ncbi:uncharacterized protein FA14DRAFT_49151 [Meira miltonrushii]|uniref:Uncharacterized protein n=1 Tax=Meira miltonrushii TaxID=1280837 RepID=A0A316VHW2_9BASI|nr:uncharacterized protein FA14DRAFT_49151 [Meira miltonrushii]PWN35933.1 hypothetical protein FA14DRAFT_49151 [Meira miltonrushii]
MGCLLTFPKKSRYPHPLDRVAFKLSFQCSFFSSFLLFKAYPCSCFTHISLRRPFSMYSNFPYTLFHLLFSFCLFLVSWCSYRSFFLKRI